MYKDSFIDLVKEAHLKSRDYYATSANEVHPNPYYIGFGNPNSKILILGKEKGFNSANKELLLYESIKNPEEWNYYIKNNIAPGHFKYHKDSEHYINAGYPYLGKMKSGHTWTKYNNLISKFEPTLSKGSNDFLKFSFISEINHEPSKYSRIRYYNNEIRINFLKHPFFRSFKIIVLACGDYLKDSLIEEIFDVQFIQDKSIPRKKLKVFSSEDRVLVNTRQLSFDVSDSYLDDIANNFIINEI